MRAIEVEWSRRHILLRVFTEGEVSSELREGFDASTATQVAADFTDVDPVPSVECQFVRCESPAPIPVRGTLVFARSGAQFSAVV